MLKPAYIEQGLVLDNTIVPDRVTRHRRTAICPLRPVWNQLSTVCEHRLPRSTHRLNSGRRLIFPMDVGKGCDVSHVAVSKIKRRRVS